MSMFYGEVLIWEDASIYRLTSFPITSNYVTTLNHETRDDTMELSSFIMKRFAIGPYTFFTWNDEQMDMNNQLRWNFDGNKRVMEREYLCKVP